MISKELRDQAIKWLKKVYSKANVDQFEFGCNNLGDAGKLKTIDIYYKITPNYKDLVLITDNRFLNNEKYKQVLFCSNIKQEVLSNINKESGDCFPKIWTSNETVQRIPESNPIIEEGYRLTDKYPDHNILNYPINNFSIYVNKTDYFMSKLPLIQITTNYWNTDWNDNESYFRVVFSIYCATYR